MECNKEEAVRARCIAEKKMQCRDFTGARKFAQKAQQLYPDLEDIAQILTVCEVHCSAETKVNGSVDWYGILQVESMADESLIKKQYRKLALLLHPDKNKFAGAEAALKLIGEAHRTLLDQAKRSDYDKKRKATIPTVEQRAPPHQRNRSFGDRKQSEVTNIYGNNSTTPLAQPQIQTVRTAPETFWTMCPCCGIRYQYYRTLINKHLRCRNCLHPFIAYDLVKEGVPPRSNLDHSLNQSGVRQLKDPRGQGIKITGQKSDNGIGLSWMDMQGNSGGRPMVPEPSTQVGIENVFAEGSRNKVKENLTVVKGIRKEHEVQLEEAKLENVNVTGLVLRSPGNPSQKRRRKMVSDTDSSNCEEVSNEESEHTTAWDAETTVCSPRRLPRQRDDVSCDEGMGSAGDFENPSNSKQVRKELCNGHPCDTSSKDDAGEAEVPPNAGISSLEVMGQDVSKSSISVGELLGFGWPTEARRRSRALDAMAGVFFDDIRGVLEEGSMPLDDARGQLEDTTRSYFFMGYPEEPWMHFLAHAWSFIVQRRHLEEAKLKEQAELRSQIAILEQDAADAAAEASSAANTVSQHQLSRDEVASRIAAIERQIESLRVELQGACHQMNSICSEISIRERHREEKFLQASILQVTLEKLRQRLEGFRKELPSIDEVMARNPLYQAPPPTES